MKLLIILLIIFIQYPSFAQQKYTEKHYQNLWCSSWQGRTEVCVGDGVRVDCMTDKYAIEFDWAKKWAEAIGQSLYYSKITGKKPAIAIILQKPQDIKYVKRIETVDKNIKIFKINAYCLKN